MSAHAFEVLSRARNAIECATRQRVTASSFLSSRNAHSKNILFESVEVVAKRRPAPILNSCQVKLTARRFVLFP